MAGDFVKYIKGETKVVREICGRNMLRHDLGKINLEELY